MVNNQMTGLLNLLTEKQNTDKEQANKYRSMAENLDKDCCERTKAIKLLQAAVKEENVNMTLAEIMN